MFAKRLAALVATLALSAGSPGLCAGWKATPEARLSCCSEMSECPMHESESGESGTPKVLTQAEADSCCAASEPDNPAPSSPAFAASMSIAPIALPVIWSASVVRLDAWRATTPLPGSPIAKHLLLSVLLV